MSSRRVVVTGIGIWSSLGYDVKEVTDSLFNGKSGIGIEKERLEYGYHSALTGIVKRPLLKGILDRRQRIGMSEEAEFAYMAANEAFINAGINEKYRIANEIGVIFGNDSSAKALTESALLMEKQHDTELIGSGNVFQSMTSTVSMNMSAAYNLRGINFSISAACASGSHSVGMAYLLIKQGLQDVILCGGAQEVSMYSMSSFDALGAFSKRMNDPQKASRPFDRDRDGLIPSGGAAALVLEDLEHALARGANILCEVSGYGFSSNGGGINKPNDDGSVIAMTRAMNDAGTVAEDIDYVNAHATSTQQGDMFEAIALAKLFHGKKALISSTKSMTGHECWMAGASELVYSILMMQNNFVAPNINFENPDEYSAKLNIAVKTEKRELNTILSNSFGFGGTNSAIILNRFCH